MIDEYRKYINQLETLVNALDREFPRPQLIEYSDQLAYRHHPSVRTDTLASFLKVVRIVSILNACLHLIQKGYAQEVNLLCRAIDEAAEDIRFFAVNTGPAGTSDKQMQVLTEFYREQHDDPNNPLTTVSRGGTSRKQIRATISNIPIDSADPHTRRTVAKSIFETLSAFVHGPYVVIMELYGGRLPKYHMQGTLDLPYMADCVDNFANHIYRSILALEVIAHRVKRIDIAISAIKLGLRFAELTKCLDNEGIESIKRRLAAVSDTELASVK